MEAPQEGSLLAHQPHGATQGTPLNQQQGQAQQEARQNESQSAGVSGGDKPLTEEVDTQQGQDQQGRVKKAFNKLFNRGPEQGQGHTQQEKQAQQGSTPEEVHQNGPQSPEVSGRDKTQGDTQDTQQSTEQQEQVQPSAGPVNRIRKLFNRGLEQGQGHTQQEKQAQRGSTPEEVYQNGPQSPEVSGRDKTQGDTQDTQQSTEQQEQVQPSAGPVNRIRKLFNRGLEQGQGHTQQEKQAQQGSTPEEVHQNGPQSPEVSGRDKTQGDTQDTQHSTEQQGQVQPSAGPVNRVRKLFNRGPEQGQGHTQQEKQAQRGSTPEEVHQNGSQSVEVSGRDKTQGRQGDTQDPQQSTEQQGQVQPSAGPVNRVRKLFNRGPEQGQGHTQQEKQAQRGSTPEEVHQNGSQSVEVSGRDKTQGRQGDTQDPQQSTEQQGQVQPSAGPVNRVRKLFNRGPEQGQGHTQQEKQAQRGSTPEEVHQNGSQSVEVSGRDKTQGRQGDTQDPQQSTEQQGQVQPSAGPVNRVRKLFNRGLEQGQGHTQQEKQAQRGSTPEEVHQNGPQSPEVSGRDKTQGDTQDTQQGTEQQGQVSTVGRSSQQSPQALQQGT